MRLHLINQVIHGVDRCTVDSRPARMLSTAVPHQPQTITHGNPPRPESRATSQFRVSRREYPPIITDPCRTDNHIALCTTKTPHGLPSGTCLAAERGGGRNDPATTHRTNPRTPVGHATHAGSQPTRLLPQVPGRVDRSGYSVRRHETMEIQPQLRRRGATR